VFAPITFLPAQFSIHRYICKVWSQAPSASKSAKERISINRDWFILINLTDVGENGPESVAVCSEQRALAFDWPIGFLDLTEYANQIQELSERLRFWMHSQMAEFLVIY